MVEEYIRQSTLDLYQAKLKAEGVLQRLEIDARDLPLFLIRPCEDQIKVVIESIDIAIDCVSYIASSSYDEDELPDFFKRSPK